MVESGKTPPQPPPSETPSSDPPPADRPDACNGQNNPSLRSNQSVPNSNDSSQDPRRQGACNGQNNPPLRSNQTVPNSNDSPRDLLRRGACNDQNNPSLSNHTISNCTSSRSLPAVLDHNDSKVKHTSHDDGSGVEVPNKLEGANRGDNGDNDKVYEQWLQNMQFKDYLAKVGLSIMPSNIKTVNSVETVSSLTLGGNLTDTVHPQAGR